MAYLIVRSVHAKGPSGPGLATEKSYVMILSRSIYGAMSAHA